MSVEVVEIGEGRHPLIIIDQALEAPERVNHAAEALAPFPAVDNNYYPGLRRLLVPGQDDAYAYVDAVCRGIAPLMRDVFGVERFSVTEASFSIVTKPAEKIEPIQCIPHYDSLDPFNFAVIHYLNRTPQGGTGFYRHRRTGHVMMSTEREPGFLAAIDADVIEYGALQPSYINESNNMWERLYVVDDVYNRIAIYQGALFHSGQIPPNFAYDSDPARGRLTGNIFLRAIR